MILEDGEECNRMEDNRLGRRRTEDKLVTFYVGYDCRISYILSTRLSEEQGSGTPVSQGVL